MPSDGPHASDTRSPGPKPTGPTGPTGRCYCGAVHVTARTPPQTVVYCHCSDCKRWTGSPLPAFAAFARDDLIAHPGLGAAFSGHPGVTRWTCEACGSPLAAHFDYLPDQIYVPLGILDETEALTPKRHCHAENQASWLQLLDDLPRDGGSARDALTACAKPSPQ